MGTKQHFSPRADIDIVERILRDNFPEFDDLEDDDHDGDDAHCYEFDDLSDK